MDTLTQTNVSGPWRGGLSHRHESDPRTSRSFQRFPRIDKPTGMVEAPIEPVSLIDVVQGLATLRNCTNVVSRLRPQRCLVLVLILLSVLAAILGVWHRLGPGADRVDNLTALLFIVNFTWISGLFWNSVAGFLKIWFGWRTEGIEWPDANREKQSLGTRNVIVMPVYNEETSRIYAGLQAIYESLAQTGHLGSFDFFILSDTTEPRIWVAEEAGWRRLRQTIGGSPHVYYRRRRKNTAKKAGNIAEFCTRWGHCYDSMVVLDADSLMTGSTLVTLARLMELNPTVGIIQVPSFSVNRSTLFARIQQFAARLYGPLTFGGLSFWQQSDGNYWGHNAIIRLSAFMENCGLPKLPGKPPFGGYIRSHDFVEAALMRRAGWSVLLLPELAGSYEESPPTIMDYVKRDLRWCQGNLQHLKIVTARGFRAVSRLHLAMGIMSYVSSLLWLAFVVATLMTAARYIRLLAFAAPNAGSTDGGGVFAGPLQAGLLAAMIVMLLGPRLLGFALLFRGKDLAPRFGGYGRAFLGMFLEIVFSALLAPTMMLFQSDFVVSTFLDRDGGWNCQQRSDKGITLAEAASGLWLHCLIGLAFAVVAVQISAVLLLLFLPVIAGLVLSIPLSSISSQLRLGLWMRRHKMFLIPEEAAPPAILSRLRALSTFWVEALSRDAPHRSYSSVGGFNSTVVAPQPPAS